MFPSDATTKAPSTNPSKPLATRYRTAGREVFGFFIP
jgi:hypothetical protein